jgi:hypothetical protein
MSLRIHDTAPDFTAENILPSVSDEEARQKYADGWKSPKPYLRLVPQPKEFVAT